MALGQAGLKSKSGSVARARYEIYIGAFFVAASVTWLVVIAAMIFANEFVDVRGNTMPLF